MLMRQTRPSTRILNNRAPSLTTARGQAGLIGTSRKETMNADERTNSLRSDVVTVASAPSPAKSRVANEALAESLDRHTTVGSLWKMEGDRIQIGRASCRERV